MQTTMILGGLTVSLYEQDGAWAVDDGDGQQVAAGLGSERLARRAALQWAERHPGVTSDEAVRSLRVAAGQAGDMLQVALCTMALGATYSDLDHEQLTGAQMRKLTGMSTGDAEDACRAAILDAAGRI